MTGEEVIQLYRNLLGRDPENTGTIELFQRYYPTVERGRRAIFTSDEFEAFFSAVTGRTPRGRDPVASSLALALLARAALRAPPPPPAPPTDAEMRAGFCVLFGGHGPKPGLAVVVGQADDLALDDLVPLGRQQSAVLHVAPGFPAVVPLAGTLSDGTTVFRLDADASTVADLLRTLDHRLDALYLLDRPADPGWVAALHPCFAKRTLLAVGRAHARPGRQSFDAAGLSDAIARSYPGEPVQLWRGLRLHHLGGWLLPVTYTPTPTPTPPDRAAYPKLAIAAIVRDEAVCVQNMLRSALPVASFYAVLDTGSTDATPALTQAFLDASGVPHAFAARDRQTFDNHFGNMRNAALAMVPDWVEWVLMLDADEMLAPEDARPLLDLIADGAHDAYCLPRYNFPASDSSGTMLSYPDRQTRLLRHIPDRRIGYQGAVHEKVLGVVAGMPPLDATAIGGGRGGPHIHHLVRRFRTTDQEARKQAFYRDIESRQGP